VTSPLKYALDPVAWVRDKLEFELDPWQERALNSTGNLILVASRQVGKSFVCSLLATHRAVFYPNSLILVASPSIRQSSELFKKVSNHIHQLGIRSELMEDNRTSCTLQNGSRIVSLPGDEKYIRGFSGVNLVILDEAARIPDELYFSVRPMLSVSKGRVVMLSSPFGKRGVLYKEWTEGVGWEKIEIPASMCPRISPEFLEEERKALGDWWYRQEYECQFVETVDQVFGYDLVMSALDPTVKPLFAGGFQ
jgi:hypothetical protein